MKTKSVTILVVFLASVVSAVVFILPGLVKAKNHPNPGMWE